MLPATPAPTPAQQYDPPQVLLQFDPLKGTALKPDMPYLPYAEAKPPLSPKAADSGSDKAHLAPLLKENWMPDSLGDRGSFMDRHEFGIQLRDHF